MISETGTQIQIPRLVIAGVASNCGKTTVARGIMAALASRGLVVQPFKVGPDFIDPSHHTRICGRVSRNLDPIMMGEAEIPSTFVRACNGADIAVIEGVMGMYDGIDGTIEGSTAHVARLLNAPVILVIPVKGMSGSVHAIAEGFKNYDSNTRLCGVILNKVGSPRHRNLLEMGKTISQLGFIPVSDDLLISSRHLGLHMGAETDIPENLVRIIEDYCDLDSIIESARNVPALHIPSPIKQDDAAIRIAIASDSAFCFYYQENIDKLRMYGAEIAFFSPIADELPDSDLLYLGGGYPELYADALARGHAKKQIKKAAQDEMPIYGECGGLMYLGRGLIGEENGVSASWVDVLPVEASIEKRFQALGYTIGSFVSGPSMAIEGTQIRGHEFHYSRLQHDRDSRFAINLTRGVGIDNGRDGIYEHNCIGAYTHAYFSAENAKNLIASARAYQKN
jgi:cobyrinic acid a,c-diamide synthase